MTDKSTTTEVLAPVDRVPVLAALAALPPMSWVLVLSAMQGVNETVRNVLADDPTPETVLGVAIGEELVRMKART